MLYSGDHLVPLSCQYWYEEKMYQPIKCTNRWKLHYMIEYWYFHLMNMYELIFLNWQVLSDPQCTMEISYFASCLIGHPP